MTRTIAALLGCTIVVGCAGPMDRRWDDTLYRSLTDRADQTPPHNDPPTARRPDLAALRELSVDDAVRIGIANSPRLVAAGHRVDVAAGKVTQAGLYPNPIFALEAESLGADAGAGGETSYVLEQEIVLGDRLGRAARVAEADEYAARAAFIAEEFALASRISNAYVAAVAAAERVRSRAGLVALAERLLDAANAQVQAGAATEPDRLRAEVAREQAAIAFDEARLDADAARKALASAMGLDGLPDLPLSTPPDAAPDLPDEAALLDAALARNARMVGARIAVERARRAYDLARAEAAPALFASAGPRYSDPDNETTLDVGVGIELRAFDRNQGNIRAAAAERMVRAAELRDAELGVRADVADAWAAYSAARLATDRYRAELIPKAERTLDLTRQAYERGKADYLRLLDAQQVVIQSRVASLNALERLHAAAARLRELAQTDAPWRAAPALDVHPGEHP